MADPHQLQRFLDAQDAGATYQHAVAELRAGRKQTHWMWFVFPQIEGLGHSSMARRYAISSLAEAKAYLEHPVLGPRLLECVGLVVELSGRTATEIFGEVDALKLRSSVTLFAHADPGELLFRRLLDCFFDGVEDEATTRRLSSAA